MSERTIKSLDMSDDMAEEVFKISQDNIEKNNIHQEIAYNIKKDCDKKFGPAWHCVVGKQFTSSITSEAKHFAYFYIGPIAVLIWRTLS